MSLAKEHDMVRLEEDEMEQKSPKSLNERVETFLLDKRLIFFSDVVTDKSANEIIRRLWYLEFSKPKEPILLVINSPGGSVDSGFAIWDQIKMISSPVTTLVTGLAASMGSILSLVAEPKRRFATSNARIMVHQPLISNVVEGQATDLKIQAEQILKTRSHIASLYAEATGKEIAVIEKTIDRDTWMSAKEAVDFGLLDGIVSSYKEIGFG